jgi:thioredoxin family protein/tetratricopeptide repeat protein
VYSDPRVAEFVQRNFIPVRVHVRANADEFKKLGARYGQQWTPTILVVDPSGEERHRIEGFLPADDLLAQLLLGLGHAALAQGRFAGAEGRFRDVVDRYPQSDAAAEALYWTGVARYKATNDPTALQETARLFAEKYRDSAWAKKASVWA